MHISMTHPTIIMDTHQLAEQQLQHQVPDEENKTKLNINSNCSSSNHVNHEFLMMNGSKICQPDTLSNLLHDRGYCLLHLNLDNNKLSELPSYICKALPLLEELSIEGNSLKSLPDDFGHYLHSLKVLCVSCNFLSGLPESLCKLKKLQVLDACCNRLEKLYSEIGQNECLHTLKVRQNLLNVLPATLGLLHNLKVLEAGENCIEFLPSTVQCMQNLHTVHLNNNSLKCLPETFGNIPNLIHLDFSKNKLVQMFENFHSAHSLQTLYLDFNMFTELPLWIGDLLNVREISVRNNKLCGNFLPDELEFASKKLTKLDLSGNHIFKVPKALCSIESLKILSMGSSSSDETLFGKCRNWLQSLPINFTNLIHLTLLHLEDNQLRTLPEDFGKLINLEELYLGSNMITNIPESFSQLASIKICQLSSNCLKQLPDNFGALRNLIELYLDFNELRKLPNSMQNLINLEILNLEGNKFKENPTNLFTGMANFKILFSNCQLEENNKIKDEEWSCSSNSEDGDGEQEIEEESTETNSWTDENDTNHSSGQDLDARVEENWEVSLNTDPSGNNGQFDLEEADSSHPQGYKYSYVSSLTWNHPPVFSYSKYFSSYRAHMTKLCIMGQFDNAE